MNPLLVTAMLLAPAQASVDPSSVSESIRQDTLSSFSCAAFPADLSETDLVARFGRENVVSAMIIGSDDGPFEGTVVFPDSDDARIDISWRSGGAKREPFWIRVQQPGSRWVTPQGIGVGMELLEVEEANGWPFRLYGFQTEGAGRVVSWGRGRLSNETATDGCSARIVFQPPYDGTTDFSLVRRVGSLSEVSSGHPAMQELNPRVVSISLGYQRRR